MGFVVWVAVPAIAAALAARYDPVELVVADLCFAVMIWLFAFNLQRQSDAEFGWGLGPQLQSHEAARSPRTQISLRQAEPGGIPRPAYSSRQRPKKRLIHQASLEAIDTTTIHGSRSPLETIRDEIYPSSQAAGKEDSNPSTLDPDVLRQKQVILVVSKCRKETAGVVDSLKGEEDWVREPYTTAAGVKIHEAKSRVIVDTIPLEDPYARSPSEAARRWMSRTGLRRIVVLGKEVAVLCVVLHSPPASAWSGLSRFSSHRSHWFEVFGLIFRPIREAVIILAEGRCRIDTRGVERFVKEHRFSRENIVYWRGGPILVESRRMRRIPKLEGMKPKKRRPIWGPERAVLFGKSGSGTLALAQMLTLGDLRPHVSHEERSREETKEKHYFFGRGWSVLYTDGFGELQGDPSVTNREVTRRVEKYVKMVDGKFSHFLYVREKGEEDESEHTIWNFLMHLFGSRVRQHFSVVVVGADERWVQENGSALRACFPGCENFFGAEFPSTPPEHPDGLMVGNDGSTTRETRNKSLSLLEEKLANRGLVDIATGIGRRSKVPYCMVERDFSEWETLGSEHNGGIKFTGPSCIFSRQTGTKLPPHRLAQLLRTGERRTLIPLN